MALGRILKVIRVLAALSFAGDARAAPSFELVERSLSVPTSLPGSWTYKGCFTEATVGRALTGSSYSNGSVTDAACVDFCASEGWIYAGTEYSSQCFCGSVLEPGANLASSDSQCSMACSGNASEPCGGSNLLTLFSNGQSGPQTNPGVAPWTYRGCYTESTSGRLLPNRQDSKVPGGTSNMTVSNCCAACQSAGYSLSGIEYSQECWCGNLFSGNGGPAPPTPDGLFGCNMLCTGNNSEYCGGSNRLNVYRLANTTVSTPKPVTSPTVVRTVVVPGGSGSFIYLGCQSEANGTRALTPGFAASDNMTLEYCAGVCSAPIAYTFFGTEYGRECYCGNALAPSSMPLAKANCSMICAGDASEFCGAPVKLSVYKRRG